MMTTRHSEQREFNENLKLDDAAWEICRRERILFKRGPRDKKSKTSGQRKNLFIRQAGICCLCFGPMTMEKDKPNTVTIEHIVPRSRMPKGSNKGKRNLRGACFECNNLKGGMTIKEFVGAYGDRPKYQQLRDSYKTIYASP